MVSAVVFAAGSARRVVSRHGAAPPPVKGGLLGQYAAFCLSESVENSGFFCFFMPY